MPRMGETGEKMPIQNLSVYHWATPLPKLFAISIERERRCWLFLNIAFQVQTHFMPIFAVLLSTSWTYDACEEYVSNHHIWQNFGFWDFKLISHFYIAISKCLGRAWKLLLCFFNSNPILWWQDKILTDTIVLNVSHQTHNLGDWWLQAWCYESGRLHLLHSLCGTWERELAQLLTWSQVTAVPLRDCTVHAKLFIASFLHL